MVAEAGDRSHDRLEATALILTFAVLWLAPLAPAAWRRPARIPTGPASSGWCRRSRRHDLGRAAAGCARRRAEPAVDALAGELAARRVPLAEAEAQVEEFARGLAGEQKDEQLTRLFARTLEIINRDRRSIVQGIRKYAHGQRALAERIAARNEALVTLAADRALERDTLRAERDWDLRVYEDRRTSLGYLCEQPVLLEQRAFALARAIAGHLE